VTTIADYTDPELIIPQVRCHEAPGVLGELCSSLNRAGRLPNILAFYNAAMSHEFVCSTVTSPGWALPHARIRGLERLSFALGRSAEPLDWPGGSGEKVKLVFLFAVPEADAGAYLLLVAGLARLSHDSPGCERLLQAPNPRAIFELLQQVQLPEPHSTARRNCPGERNTPNAKLSYPHA
jgi:nitrogen PTS system EIIA component